MKYSESHEWIELADGNNGVVGVSYHAQHELGDIVYVELPGVGKSVKAGQEAAVLESTKAAADIYSPVSGTVTEVNTALKSNPELINQSPEKDGWLFKIRLANPSELSTLKDRSAYEAMLKTPS
jgi:glycine cleavage system H protein